MLLSTFWGCLGLKLLRANWHLRIALKIDTSVGQAHWSNVISPHRSLPPLQYVCYVFTRPAFLPLVGLCGHEPTHRAYHCGHRTWDNYRLVIYTRARGDVCTHTYTHTPTHTHTHTHTHTRTHIHTFAHPFPHRRLPTVKKKSAKTKEKAAENRPMHGRLSTASSKRPSMTVSRSGPPSRRIT